MPTLVDTSVFVDFLRGKETPAFKELLLSNEILLSQYVRLELLQGVRKQELRQFEYVLGGLQIISPQKNLFAKAEEIIGQIKGKGLRLGIVDLLIAAEAKILDVPIYSYDLIFKKMVSLNLCSLFEPS